MLIYINYKFYILELKDETSCKAQSTATTTYQWGVPYDSKDFNHKECFILLSPPACHKTDWTRSNHLGNTEKGSPPTFKWELPYFPSNRIQTCVFRIRYNVTSSDYNQYTANSSSNGIK